MKRASIWDIRDLRGGPSSPRKASPATAHHPPIGPRLARPPPAAARLSGIGRIAIHEGAAPYAAVSCGQAVLPPHAAAYVTPGQPAPPYGGQAPGPVPATCGPVYVQSAPGSAPPAVSDSSGGRHWHGEPRPGPHFRRSADSAPTGMTPRSARGCGRSLSAPRAYHGQHPQHGRSGSVPRGASAARGGSTGGLQVRAASSLDCPAEREACRLASGATVDSAAAAIANAVAAATAGCMQPGTNGATHTEPSAASTRPNVVPNAGFARSYLVQNLDEDCLEGRDLQARPASFADTIECLLKGDSNSENLSVSPRSRARRCQGSPSPKQYVPPSPSGYAQSLGPSIPATVKTSVRNGGGDVPRFAASNGIAAPLTAAGVVDDCSVDSCAAALGGALRYGSSQEPASFATLVDSDSLGMIPYCAPADEEAATPGLGLVQPRGRSLLLQEMAGRLEQTTAPAVPRQSRGGRPPRAPLNGDAAFATASEASMSLRPSVPAPAGAAQASDVGSELTWSSFSESSRQALRRWTAGHLGGRHCMLVIEQGAGMDSSTSVPGQDEPTMSQLREGAALNVLSGLQAEIGLIGGQEGGWLFESVFSKNPAQVLNEALSAILHEINDPKCAQPSDISAEQANLALRRIAMKHQFEVSRTILAGATPVQGARAADEFARIQVWLELMRLHSEGFLTFGSGGATASSSSKEKQPKADRTAVSWNDGGVIRELGKAEVDLETESHQMGLEELRTQNKLIEEYVMRLVRRRDDLRSVTKLAEESDSYFILGLDGPAATDEEVKKAYRNLARKEHPDKAGIGNKKRFQAIQQAYTAVLNQRREGEHGHASESLSPRSANNNKNHLKHYGPSVHQAHAFAQQAMDSANHVAGCAHITLRACEETAKLQSMPKKKALRILRDLTQYSVTELHTAAGYLRALGEAICGVSSCADSATNEHKEWAALTVAGIGLRDRAVIVEDAGRSALESATLLEKIAEATEATLRKVERASPDAVGNADGGLPPRNNSKGGSDAAGLLNLGVRLLTESLSRTSAVARRAADEAIGGATKALELGRGLMALDMEARKERERQEAKKQGFDEDVPMPAGDMDRTRPGDGQGTNSEPPSEAAGESAPTKTPRCNSSGGMNGQASPRDQLKCAAKRVKERHVALRVKNLRFLTSLNEEALRMQKRLWSLLERSKGALLPEISVMQKGRLFDLVAQLLDFSLAECTRLTANTSVPSSRILDRALAFALALEHTKDIAMPSDSRTQALKLAALIDMDLLCQIIDGPFKTRLLTIGARRRPATERAAPASGGYSQSFGSRRTSLGRSESSISQPGAQARSWEEAVDAACSRVVQGLRCVVDEGRRCEQHDSGE